MVKLKRNEIEMLQYILVEGVSPTEGYCVRLANKLEEIKAYWYKVNKKKVFVISESSEVKG